MPRELATALAARPGGLRGYDAGRVELANYLRVKRTDPFVRP